MRVSTGKVVAFTPDKRGYARVQAGPRGVGTVIYHRLKYFLGRGWLPGVVDHRDGNPRNNALNNLRAADLGQNQHNRGVSRRNKLGVRGVTQYRGRFRAGIMVDSVYRRLGTFDTPEQASAAYEAAARELHGEFYRPPT